MRPLEFAPFARTSEVAFLQHFLPLHCDVVSLIKVGTCSGVALIGERNQVTGLF